MKLFGILIATAALGAALVASGPAAAFRDGGWYPNNYSSGYGCPYDYSSGYGYPYDYSSGYGPAAVATAPLVTGRSVAVGGNYCATPVKTCLLSHTSWVGNGCSCTVYRGHARGTVE